ncbi:PP2C family protein-serine/threonine phosphatase [Streptomyces sp. NPDC060194]|uniref:PP2C family protein-serine/threonine phosphatase n=1 Tax=Streptomyces sp. NPDC060194 TaxID=3347069 RepID=UPI003655D56F
MTVRRREGREGERVEAHGTSAADARDWSGWLHTMWRTADRAEDVTALADIVYRALVSRPGVLLARGTRWTPGGLSYLRYLRAGEETPVTRRAPVEGRVKTVPCPTAYDGPVIVLDETPDRAVWPGGPELAPAAATALECAFPLADDDWATLRVVLDHRPAPDDPLYAQLAQVVEVLTTSNHRIVEHQAHDRRQVEDAFLAEASLQMDASLDVEETLRRVARLAVPAVAEGCVVHLFEPDGELAPVASAHVAATAQSWLGEVARTDPWLVKLLRDSGDRRESTVLRGAELAGGPFGPAAKDQGAAVTTLSVSPLRARGRALGTLTFLYHRPDALGDTRMLGDLASRAALAIDTSTLYEQRRNHVEVLQRHLLPGALPRLDGLELSAAYEVADASLDVGGDFYDAVVAGDQVALVVGDVCGRGAEAAAVTGLARHTLRTLLQDRVAPGDALARLNGALLGEGASRFVTALIAVLTPAGDGGWDVEIASAGHPRPLVRRADGAVEEADVSGVLLGVLPAPAYRPARLALGPDDALVMFTDGLTEAKGAGGRFFEEDLPGVVGRSVDGAPDPAGRLIRLASDFRQTGDDDTAILIVSVDGRAVQG